MENYSFYNNNEKHNNNTAKSIVSFVPQPPSNEPTKDLVQNVAENTDDKKDNRVKYYVKFSFMITYILLLTTATLTFIEAMRTNKPHARHVLNLETCISVVAGYFYGVFLGQIDENEKQGKDIKLIWEDITKTRYVDWCITTPLMLLVLCIVLSNNSKTQIYISTFLMILALNYCMLFIGFLGEFHFIERTVADVLGFIPFFIMFYIIFDRYVSPVYRLDNYILYFLYIIIWGLYGVVYMMDEYVKNISMNILDCLAKCFIGNALFIYYANILSIG